MTLFSRPEPRIVAKMAALFRNQPALGAWIDIPSVSTAEIMASVGFDFLIIDLEHGPASLETAQAQILAAERWGAAALVRTPKGARPWVGRALDLGAQGIMAPMIETPEEAEALVAATRYGPAGRRGCAAPIIRAARFGADPDYESRWNASALVIAQIESPAALAQAEAIASVDGIDALFFGPADYAAAAGYPGGAAVVAAWRQCRDAAREAGKAVGTTPLADLSARAVVEDGADLVTAGSDIATLRSAAEAALAAARGED